MIDRHRYSKSLVPGHPGTKRHLEQDFVIDEYQVDEALAHGADTVLLMVPWPRLARHGWWVINLF